MCCTAGARPACAECWIRWCAAPALLLVGVIIWWGWAYALRGQVQMPWRGWRAFSTFRAYLAMPVGGVFSVLGILANLLDPQRQELETAQ